MKIIWNLNLQHVFTNFIKLFFLLLSCIKENKHSCRVSKKICFKVVRQLNYNQNPALKINQRNNKTYKLQQLYFYCFEINILIQLYTLCKKKISKNFTSAIISNFSEVIKIETFSNSTITLQFIKIKVSKKYVMWCSRKTHFKITFQINFNFFFLLFFAHATMQKKENHKIKLCELENVNIYG